MKIGLMTDLEGVAGVIDSVNWCRPEGRYYELAKEYLTQEVNAAVRGFFDGGATVVQVIDGHGCGAIDVGQLDSRVEYARGWPEGWPFGLDSTFDAVAWVGQHAKASTEYAHLAHTQSMEYIDLSVNGVSIGEFGQLAMCAGELGIPVIFGSGDEAFIKEAKALAPWIETVSVKRGVTPGRGEELNPESYRRRNTGAVHLTPTRSRELIYDGAKRAMARFDEMKQGIVRLEPPYEAITVLRPDGDQPRRTLKKTHPSSFIALMNGR